MKCPECDKNLFVNVFTIDKVSPFSQLGTQTNARHVTTGYIACLYCTTRSDIVALKEKPTLYADFNQLEKAYNDRHNNNSDKTLRVVKTDP